MKPIISEGYIWNAPALLKKFVCFCHNVGWATPSKIQKAECFNIQHTQFSLQFRHCKNIYLTSVLVVFSYGNHPMIILKDLTPKAESPLKSHFHLHFRRKENKHPILEEGQGIHLDVWILATGMEAEQAQRGRFAVFWHWFILLLSLQLKTPT